MTENSWTPTEAKIIAVLSDGKTHKRAELKACLSDDMAKFGAVHVHLTAIRKRLRMKTPPEDIKAVLENRGVRYIHVRLITY